MIRARNFKDIAGQRFGMLVTIALEGIHGRSAHWTCACDCGNTTVVSGHCLRRGQTKSCGCIKSAKTAIRNTKHSMADTPEYDAWCKAKRRCFNPKDNRYSNYGARGITMCPEWVASFDSFFRHIGPRPAGAHLDRINNDGNYEPGNVRWATRTASMRNRQDTILVTHDGETLTLKEWSERTGIPYPTLFGRYSGRRKGPLFAIPRGG